MKPNKTSNGICKVFDAKIVDIYKAHCECTSDDHVQTLFIEYDGDINQIVLRIFSNIRYDIPYEQNFKGIRRIRYWLYRQKCKIIAALKILIDGRLEAENEFIFFNEKQIRDYCDALYSSIGKMKKNSTPNNCE